MADRAEYPPPLTIGVLSDTHVYANSRRRLPPEVLDLFRRAAVDLLIHAGDISYPGVLDTLESIAPVIAVSGNNEVAELYRELPERVDFTSGRFSFAVVHGHQGRTARATARTYAGKVDCVVYGHSHIPMIEDVSGTTLFNPGSPTDRRWRPHFGVGLIRVTSERCQPELILFTDPAHLATVDVAASAYTDQ